MAVTSKDVAAKAGVSRSAVSLVLNGRAAGNLSAATQRKVLRAARELGYRPNASAVNLRRQSTSTIGLVTDEIATTAFAGDLLLGARDVALARGYLMFAVDTGFDADREEQAIDVLRSRQVDGFLYASVSVRPTAFGKRVGNTPTVLANCFAARPGDEEYIGKVNPRDADDVRGPHADDDAVTAGIQPDDRAGGYAAARAVLDAGHRDVVLLGGSHPPNRPPSPAVERRAAGFRAAMNDVVGPGSWQTPVAGGVRIRQIGWSIDAGFAAASTILDRPDRPTAVLAANDRLALGVLLAAARLGLDVPGDLSLVGYDDEGGVADATIPPLTTVALPHRQMGELAMRLLLDAIASGDRSALGQGQLVPCELVSRGSVGSPAST